MAHFLPQAAIFDLDGTLTDSMYVWDHIPEELVRRFGGHPAPDLSHTLRAMSSPQAIDYLIRTYHLPASSQQLMEALEAARQLGAAPQHTLVFEDALHAAQTAVQAGFQVVGVYDAFSAEDQPALKAICRWHLKQLDDPSFLAQLG